MTKESLIEQGTAFFFKVLLPPLVGVSVKVGLIMQREKLTTFKIILAYVIGVGTAWLCSPIIFDAVSANYAPMILATVAITGDKIAEFLIYKFNVDAFIMALLDNFINSIKSKK